MFQGQAITAGVVLLGGLALALMLGSGAKAQSGPDMSIGKDPESIVSGGVIQLAGNLRPAAKAESPEEKQVRELPQPPSPEQIRMRSKAQRLQACERLPKCRAALQKAKRGERPQRPLPAAREESPEEKQLKSLPPPPEQRERSPRSGLLQGPGAALLSKLNPFYVGEAQAQTEFSLIIKRTTYHSRSPYGYTSLYGGYSYYGEQVLPGYWTHTHNQFTQSENRPYIWLVFDVPTTGWYLIDFWGYKALAKLRHQYNGPIVDTWDFSSSTDRYPDYLTAQFLEAGRHTFYFWTTSPYFVRILEISVESH
jgi:hypothetical protein